MAYPNNPSSAVKLLEDLPAKFETARQSGELFFFPSTAKDVTSGGWRFNVRCCPALQDKAKAKAEALAKASKSDSSPEAKRPKLSNGSDGGQNSEDPFKPPYVPELYVGCLEGLEGEEGMSILLNKYALLPEHMLLCPPTRQPQDLPPTPQQLALAYQVLQTANRHPTRPRRLLAFYNGGEGAGASQKWRHLQFVEVPNGGAPLEDWMRRVTFQRQDEAILHPELPYLHIIHPLATPPYPPTEESSSQLIDMLAPALMKSLDLCFDAIRWGQGNRQGGWNLLMTLDHLHLIPRSAPSYPLQKPHSLLEINSLGYAGMLLVKSEEEEQTLASSVEGGSWMKVLQHCGVPREWGEKALDSLNIQQGHADTI